MYFKIIAQRGLGMPFVKRLIQETLRKTLKYNKSILLLGPRQTGKTTLVEQLTADIDLTYTFLDAKTRRRFEENPDLLISEIKGYKKLHTEKTLPIVLIDEVQKVPEIMDTVQLAIDDKIAIFILTGSSARKLRHDREEINLLPGRVIELFLDALSLQEIEDIEILPVENLLIFGSLPEVLLQKDQQFKEHLLVSYVNIYLEEEIRVEAIVRNLATFSRFLTFAAVDAGKLLNVSKLSKDIGVSRNTIEDYYQILEDCLIADRIEPVIDSTTRRRLSKAPKYLFFDLGIRRIAAGEGTRLPQKYMSDLFEQFIGIELLKLIRIFAPQAKCRYWRDHGGPEVDYVLEYNRKYLPIEVKWTDKPSLKDARHLTTFIEEYECVSEAYIVCQTPRAMEITPEVTAINWKEMPNIIQRFLQN